MLLQSLVAAAAPTPAMPAFRLRKLRGKKAQLLHWRRDGARPEGFDLVVHDHQLHEPFGVVVGCRWSVHESCDFRGDGTANQIGGDWLTWAYPSWMVPQ